MNKTLATAATAKTATKTTKTTKTTTPPEKLLPQKTLLIVGAGIEACEGINIAQAMGLRLIIADGNPKAPGFDFADRAILASTYDPDAIIHALREADENPDGAIAMCADVPVTIARIAETFNLPGLSARSAYWVADKFAMKQRLQEQKIPIPKFCAINNDTSFTELADCLGLPFVLKPVDGRGARGVQLIDEEELWPEAVFHALQVSPSKTLMAESYLRGPQISTETLIDHGRCYTLGFCDRNYEWLDETRPFFIENGGDAPSALSEKERQAVIDCVESAANALGIHSGVAKGDMVLTADGPCVIEIAGRLSGGFFSSTQIPLSTGVNFVEQAIRLALGSGLQHEKIASARQDAVAIRYLKLKPGKVRKIRGKSRAEHMPGVERLALLVHSGDEIAPLSNHTQRSGFVICTGEDKQEAVERAQAALAQLRIEME